MTIGNRRDELVDREYTNTESRRTYEESTELPGMSPPEEEPDESRPRVARAEQPASADERGGAAATGRRRAVDRMDVSDAELGARIEEEIEDYEREASCSSRRALADEQRAPAGGPAASAEGVPSTRGAARLRRRGAEGRARPAEGHGGVPAVPPGTEGERAPSPRPRIDYRAAAPDAVAAMSRLEAYVRRCGLEPSLLELVKLRASQLNGCAYCVDMHTKDARRAGETEQRLYMLQVWREAPFFSERERAALAWTEAVTRLGPDHVDDETFRAARARFGDRELVDLTMAIIAINGWNRLAIAFRAEPGSYHPREAPASP